MQIPFLILLLPLGLWPVWSHEMLARVHAREAFLLHADNAAIRFGRLDREVLRELSRLAKQLTALEVAHHPLHLCALATPEAHCAASDRLIERAIAVAVSRARVLAGARWRSHPARAKRELRKGDRLCAMRRPATLPLTISRCEVCGLRARLTLEREEVFTTLAICPGDGGERARYRMRLLRPGGREWNYAISLSE